MNACGDDGKLQFYIFGIQGDPDRCGRKKAEKMALMVLKEKWQKTRSYSHGNCRSRSPFPRQRQTSHEPTWRESKELHVQQSRELSCQEPRRRESESRWPGSR